MSNPGTNSNLNVNRHYQFEFFNVLGTSNFTIAPIGTCIQDSVNFSFNYSVVTSYSNTATFAFYNLSKAAISLFSDGQNRRGFFFNAWYGNNNQGNITIFRGLTSVVSTYRIGADVITEVTASDMITNLGYLESINHSFPINTTYLTVVQTLLKDYGAMLTLDPRSNQFLTGTYKTPQTFTGDLQGNLRSICADAGLLFTSFLGIITMVPSQLNVITGNDYQNINDGNGLVGFPRAIGLSTQLFPIFYAQGSINLNQNLSLIAVSTLLRPYPLYSKILLKSENFTGYYGVLNVTYEGEWRGNTWYSDLTLYPYPSVNLDVNLVG